MGIEQLQAFIDSYRPSPKRPLYNLMSMISCTRDPKKCMDYIHQAKSGFEEMANESEEYGLHISWNSADFRCRAATIWEWLTKAEEILQIVVRDGADSVEVAVVP